MSAPKRAAAAPRRKTASAAGTPPRRKTSASRNKTSAQRNKPSAPRKKPAPAKPKPRTNAAHHTPARPRRKLQAAAPRRKTAARKAAPRAIKIAPPPREADPLAKKTGRRLNYYTPEFLAEAKRRIETTLQSTESIALDLGTHRSNLWRLIRREGWVRPEGALRLRGLSPAMRIAAQVDALTASLPPPGGGRSPTEGRREGVIAERTLHPNPALTDVRADPPPPGEGGAEPAARANVPTPTSIDNTVIDRFEAAVLKELATVETMRANLGKEPQRPIDAERTARTLSVLTETIAKLRRLRLADQPQQDSHYDDMPADIDEFRRDFARRLDAFVASRTDAGSAEPAGPADQSDPV